jgi:predicted Zn-dependent protease
MKNIKYQYLLIAFVFFSIGCSKNPVTGKREIMLMSESQELALGQESDPSIVAIYGKYDDPKMQEFINAKGKEMAAISHRPDLPYEFKILDSPVVNAFAVPGGYVYFTRGIMAHFNNEAEFAGVLGHELGHITARHSAKQYSKQMLAQVLFIGGLVVSEDFRNFADLANQGIGLLFLKFSRDNESESDKLGVDYSTQVGYNADEMAGFFNTLQSLSGEGGSVPTFLSTHPDPGDRYNNVGKYADEVQAKAGLDDSTLKVNRESYLRMIDGLVYGEDPRQGYFENSYFYQPEMKFQLPVPNGWTTINTPAQVQMASSDGKAMISLSLHNATSLEEAASQVVQINELTVLDKTNTTVNGLPALAMLSHQNGQSANGQETPSLKILTYLIQYNGLIYKMHGMATTADFNAYHNTFSGTMKGFRELTDASKMNRVPSTIKIVSVKSTGTLQSALNSYSVANSQHNELAILNGMSLNDQVNAGELIKIITAGSMSSTSNIPSSTTNSPSTPNTPNTPTTTKDGSSEPTNTTNPTDNDGKTVIKTKVKKPTKLKN